MANKGVRQGIHFDLDTKALQRYYPDDSWQSAYNDVRTFLRRNGFVHEQGSGYHSIEPMTQADAVSVLTEMLDVYHPIQRMPVCLAGILVCLPA